MTPTTIPLVIPPNAKAHVNSVSDKGGIKISTIFPWTFEIKIEVNEKSNDLCCAQIESKANVSSVLLSIF